MDDNLNSQRRSWSAPQRLGRGKTEVRRRVPLPTRSRYLNFSLKPIRFQSFPFFILSLLHVKLRQDSPVNVRTGLEPYTAADRTCQAR